MKFRVGTAALLLAWANAASAQDFQVIGNPDQVRQITRSLQACRSLGKRLTDLAKTRGFRGIRVATSAETRTVGPFNAAVSGNEIVLASDWLGLQDQPYFDIRHEGEILPDNLCFDLGHLSDHVAHPVEPPPGPESLKAWIDQRLRQEGLAYLRAWPFVLEAARARNSGKPPNPAQIADLMLDLRYRFAFLKAMDAQARPRLTVLADGTIPESDANITAVANALSGSAIADLQ